MISNFLHLGLHCLSPMDIPMLLLDRFVYLIYSAFPSIHILHVPQRLSHQLALECSITCIRIRYHHTSPTRQNSEAFVTTNQSVSFVDAGFGMVQALKVASECGCTGFVWWIGKRMFRKVRCGVPVGWLPTHQNRIRSLSQTELTGVESLTAFRADKATLVNVCYAEMECNKVPPHNCLRLTSLFVRERKRERVLKVNEREISGV
ncbi:hypothetical protein BGX38DRAFT_649516 [Terfezia claveryi]|nr:hypothetical protein BGX38DRAFT_649516 [Terfezia claveryi]